MVDIYDIISVGNCKNTQNGLERCSSRMEGCAMKQGWNEEEFDEIEETDAPFESRKVWELSAYEREQVIEVYGAQPDSERSIQCMRPVHEVRTLNAWERAVFEGQSLVSSKYCIQILYKIRGEIERSELQQAAQQLFAENAELRVHFLPLGWGEKMHKLIFQKMMPDIRYRNMENIADDSIDRFLKKMMEDEQEKGFDMERSPLVRFYLLKTPGRTSRFCDSP